MPLLKRRYNHAMIWRPNGTPYSQGESRIPGTTGAAVALKLANDSFAEEFGRPVDEGRVLVAEIVFGGTTTRATIYELPD